MATKYMVAAYTDCPHCNGTGAGTAGPEGDECQYCGGDGATSRTVALADALRGMDAGNAQPVTGNTATEVLDTLRYMVAHDRPEERISAFALAAIAEQLAAMNEHLSTIALAAALHR